MRMNKKFIDNKSFRSAYIHLKFKNVLEINFNATSLKIIRKFSSQNFSRTPIVTHKLSRLHNELY